MFNIEQVDVQRMQLAAACKAGHNGSNLGSNITHLKTNLLMWHVVNE